MADQRARHRHVEGGRIERRDLSVVPEEDALVADERKSMKPYVTKSKDATVEVIVKVKKRRDKPGDGEKKKWITIPENGFRKGSWGDLLLRKSGPPRKEGDEEKQKKSDSPKSKKHAGGGDCGRHLDGKNCINEHSPLCQKIPINDYLYLETHTHFRKLRPLVVDDDEINPASSLKRISSTSTSASNRHAALLKENEELWEEVERLRKEMEFSKSRKLHASEFEHQKVSKVTSAPAVIKERSFCSSRGQTQGTQTSDECVTTAPSKKRVEISQTDGNHKSPPRTSQQASSTKVSAAVGTADISQWENSRLEKENEALRREATDLLTQVNKARSDYIECYNTMKELYQIAATLKQENNNLTQTHQQQQTLQAKLLQALAENREIKEVLDTLMNKPKSTSPSPGIGEDQLLQVRNVIQDVRRTIAQEMEVLELPPKTRLGTALRAEKDNNLNGAFRLEESGLNDTNASEIQHIFGSHPPEMRRGVNQEDRSSSTQYLTLGGMSNADCHYRPSPCPDDKFSPRISTPNSSNISETLSEAAVAAGINSFRPIEKAPITRNDSQSVSELSADDTGENEWHRLEKELAKSFGSVRSRLSQSQSTTSYSSNSSTSSPNPARRN